VGEVGRSLSCREPRRIAGARLTRAVAVALALASIVVGVSAVPAAASPQTDFVTATAQAAKLQLQIADNGHRADVLDERYLQAQSAVAAALRKIDATQKEISATDASAGWLRKQLAGRAALLYMGAGSVDPIGMNVSSVQDLGSRAHYGEAAAQQNVRILDVLARIEEHLNAQRGDLTGQLAAAQDQQRAADGARREVVHINASMQKLLDSTNANVKTLAARMEREALAAAAAAERARLQRLAEKQAAERRAKIGAGGGGRSLSPDPGSIGAGPGQVAAPSAGAAAAVAYAQAQLGKPYVYAGAGPDSFDCSGLTMMAWLQGGVSMAHGSQAQYAAFPHVPIDMLQPGDLVFFGPSGPTNEHVGIVVGPGMMIDAPHTGAFVELVSYYRTNLVLMGARPGAP
jgi:peptidoglycan DL-endopeptidase CwlO